MEHENIKSKGGHVLTYSTDEEARTAAGVAGAAKSNATGTTFIKAISGDVVEIPNGFIETLLAAGFDSFDQFVSIVKNLRDNP